MRMKSSMILKAANALPKERIAFFFGFFKRLRLGG